MVGDFPISIYYNCDVNFNKRQGPAGEQPASNNIDAKR